MRSRIVVVGLCTVVGLWLAPVAQAKAKARDKSPAAPSSVTYPYGSFVANSTCQSSGGVTCQGSSASVDPANGAATLVAKVSGTNGAATATEQGVLQTILECPGPDESDRMRRPPPPPSSPIVPRSSRPSSPTPS